eukprot:357870-Amphidinium_carterae.1
MRRTLRNAEIAVRKQRAYLLVLVGRRSWRLAEGRNRLRSATRGESAKPGASTSRPEPYPVAQPRKR